MNTKLKNVILLLCVVIFALTGCTSSNSETAQESHLDRVIKSKKLRVAVLPDNPPWSVMKADGSFAGYDIDIANKLAEALGVEVEFVPTEGANRLPLVQTDKVDVVIACFSPTNERAKSINFTEPYAVSGSLPLYRKDNPLKSWEDLKEKKVSVARGSTNDTILTKYFPKTEVVRFDTISDAFMALKSGKVDALLEQNQMVYEMARKNPELEALNAEPFKPSLVAMAVKRGDHDWLNYLNSFIRNFNASGDNAELYKKWFGTEMPKIVNY